MTPEDRVLLRRLRERDESAFREFVAAHKSLVLSVTYRMLGNRAEAEDLAQEVFIAVFKTIDTFREESKFSTWLYRIAVNHSKNRIKYLSRRHANKQDELSDDNAGMAANSPGAGDRLRNPDKALAGAQMEILLQAAIDTLDDDHKTLVVLRDIEELSVEEICEITGLPDGTVKSRLHRARAALRKKLQRHL